MNVIALDLTKRPPRSPRVRLGGFVILPRLLDKGRATIVGTNGEYHYNCPMDQRLFEFLGVDAEALKEQLKAGKGDWEIFQWILAKAKNKLTAAEIESWSKTQERRAPEDAESRDYFNGLLAKAALGRKDITTWFELLDVDDFASYGGRA